MHTWVETVGGQLLSSGYGEEDLLVVCADQSVLHRVESQVTCTGRAAGVRIWA